MLRQIATALITLTLAVITSVAAIAGSLTPPGAPAPTMRSIEQVKPTWDKIIPAAQRFVDALDGTAVLDKETGLVWAKTLNTLNTTLRTWLDAKYYCENLVLGGRMGWRLPTPHELASLIDSSVSGTLKLPAGHPFQGISPWGIWTSSTSETDAADAYVFRITMLDIYGHYEVVGVEPKSLINRVWPVRGGQ